MKKDEHFFHQLCESTFWFLQMIFKQQRLIGNIWHTINIQSAWEVTLYCGVACVLGMVKFTISAQWSSFTRGYKVTYSLIAFDRESNFFCVRSLPCACGFVALLRVGSRITITQSHTHAMQQTHKHKAVTGHVEAKKLLSRRRQSEYSQGWWR